MSEKRKQEQIFLGDNRIASEFCLLFEDLTFVHLLVAVFYNAFVWPELL